MPAIGLETNAMKFIHLLMLIVALGSLVGCASGKRTLAVEGQNRAYYLHVPASYAEGTPLPLLLALHQFSDTASGMRKLSGFDAIAEREGFIVCYPQGRWRVWNSGQGRNNTDDVALLSQLVETLATQYSIDRDRVYATGISAGGMMAQYLACQTDLLAGVAAVAGSPVRSVLETCARPTPILTIHGEADNIVPYAGGDVSAGGGDMSFASARETADAWARINGCDAANVQAEVLPPLVADDPSRITKYTYSCNAKPPVVFLSVGNAGHTWPGRDNWYPAFIVGNTSMQLDTSETIWAFLEQVGKEQRQP
jgi:polyhydroxybutyrate depolymerase